MQGVQRLLRSLQSLSKEALVQSRQSRRTAIKHMNNYIRRLQLDLNSLSVIHVAGTKGKGSTCAFTEAILRAHGFRTALYTSPHLVNMRERFRINGQSVRQDLFMHHVYTCYQRLFDTTDDADESPLMPSFFRFLTLVGYQLFTAEKVDVVVLETGLGGRLDATNVFPHPVVCGITLIDYDHMEVLGSTLELIAAEKAGIIKNGVPVFSVSQPDGVRRVLRDCAAAKNAEFAVVPDSPQDVLDRPTPLGVAGEHQMVNASLAVHLAQTWIEIASPSTLHMDTVANALAKTTWPGRCQVVEGKSLDKPIANVSFYVDGAHTPKSMEACDQWFKLRSRVKQDTRCVLLFNCSHAKDPMPLLSKLTLTTDYFVTCPFNQDKPHLRPPPRFKDFVKTPPPRSMEERSWQHTLMLLHEHMFASSQRTQYSFHDSNAIAIGYIRKLAEASPDIHFDVLVAGSLYLAGDTLGELRVNVQCSPSIPQPKQPSHLGHVDSKVP